MNNEKVKMTLKYRDIDRRNGHHSSSQGVTRHGWEYLDLVSDNMTIVL